MVKEWGTVEMTCAQSSFILMHVSFGSSIIRSVLNFSSRLTAARPSALQLHRTLTQLTCSSHISLSLRLLKVSLPHPLLSFNLHPSRSLPSLPMFISVMSSSSSQCQLTVTLISPEGHIQTALPSKCDLHLWPDLYSQQQTLIRPSRVNWRNKCYADGPITEGLEYWM